MPRELRSQLDRRFMVCHCDYYSIYISTTSIIRPLALTLNWISSSLQVGRIECKTLLAPACTSCSSIEMGNSAILSLDKVGLELLLLLLWWLWLVVFSGVLLESVRWISDPMFLVGLFHKSLFVSLNFVHQQKPTRIWDIVIALTH